MSTLQMIKGFIHQKLAVVVDEILGLVETTVQNYEEEIQRQKKIIESERAQTMVHNSNNIVSEQAMRFRVIIGEDIKKITFENGLPFCMNDFLQVVKQAFSLGDDIRLHYKDSDFDDFFTLTSTRELKDKDTLKVVQLSKNTKSFMTPAQNFTSVLSEISGVDEIPPIEFPELPSMDTEETFHLNSKEQLNLTLDLQDCASVPSEDTASLNIPTFSDAQDNALVGPSDSFVTARKLWTGVFEIPTFSYTTELVLRKANEKFLVDGTLITPDQIKSIKSDILERIAETMYYTYTAYPKDSQRMIACQALIKKHPCLKERGCASGCDGWNNSLMYKISNYRVKLRSRGSQEVLINSLKRKQEGNKHATQVKKPRKSEVNFLPPLPLGETVSSLEELRVRLVELHQRGASAQVINELMNRTYSYRRQEVVTGNNRVEELKERWPALFTPAQINEEFKRCNTIPLQTVFMSNLDKYIPKLLTLFSSVGGALGQRLKSLWLELVETPGSSAVKKRDVVLQCLIEYMGDRISDLVSEHSGVPEEEVLNELKSDSLKIFVCSRPDSVGVVIDGTPVLRGVDSLSSACCLLFGLLYALNIDYPPSLFKTFDLFQRLLVGLDSIQPKINIKLMKLKNKLLNIN